MNFDPHQDLDALAQEQLDVLAQERLDVFIRMAFETLNPGETFLPNWHLDTIAWHLEQCYRRENKRLIINVPPRYMKSISASIAFPACGGVCNLRCQEPSPVITRSLPRTLRNAKGRRSRDTS